MDECYLCGRELINKPSDFEENRRKYDSLPVRHGEHIIQNALHGRLVSSDILCERCGNSLNDEIDRPFNELFVGFTESLAHVLAGRDHGQRGTSRTLRGTVFKEDGKSMRAHVNSGKVTPLKPSFELLEDEGKVRIYCSEREADNYPRKVEKELQTLGIDYNSLQIEIVTDLSSLNTWGVNFSEGVEGFNEKFKLGLNKIATGFAVSNGIDRSSLPSTLDCANRRIIHSANVVAFFPCGALDLALETFRDTLEYGYPTHTLILYTEKIGAEKKLVCYIDLFSTFQHYVILNHDYQGADILKTYYQTILRQEKPLMDIRSTRPKELLLVAGELGIPGEAFRGKSLEEAYRILEDGYKKWNPSYILDLSDYFRKATESISFYVMVGKAGSGQLLDEETHRLLKGLPVDDAFAFAIGFEARRIAGEDGIRYRRNFVELDDSLQPYLVSSLQKMITLNNDPPASYSSYGHYKFHQLSGFTDANKPASEVQGA